MVATRETWTFDGWSLEAANARVWTSREGTHRVSAPTGSNTTVPRRDGELWRPKTMPAATFTVDIVIYGTDHGLMLKQWALIKRAMCRPREQVEVRRRTADGRYMFCQAEWIGQVEPQFIGQIGMRASVDFKIARGRWYGIEFNEWSIDGNRFPTGGQPGLILPLPQLADSDAPIDYLYYEVKGAATAVKISEYTGGVRGAWVSYAPTIGSGSAITLNNLTFAIGSSGFTTVDRSKVRFSGDSFLTLQAPRPGQVPQLLFEVSSPNAQCKLNVSGRAAYLS